ncbi:restriction endonuclease subunit S [Burkholderia stagnalis]|uniref:restriction endonuclease subunit S n=1 Tax=Burkholderia stagnalis TaxID=1503054 RepID=UPI002AB42E8C|nr:restriction endonuclease subunit S [Burkholderia stagnalis]MDY7807450.1 restriction endonuclease subunit S [Burkholderia stagnalis]
MMTLRPLLLDSRDGEWGKGEPGPDSVEMRVIRGTDFDAVRQGQVEGVPTRFLERRHADRKRLQPWDIILETAGGSPDRPTGRTILVTPRTIELLGEDVTCASFARFLRVDPTQVDPAYLFWLLQHHYECRDLLAFHTQHTGVARFQFTTFSNSFEFELPSLETQRQIAGILGTYDDLIEVNRRRIVVLNKMARGLFDEWFVRFRFPGYEGMAIEDIPDGPLPAGWHRAKVGEVLQKIKRPIKIQKQEYISTGSVPCIDQGANFIGGYTDNQEAVIASPLPMCVFGDHTRILKFITFPFASGADGTQLLYPTDELTPVYLYLALINVDLSNQHYARHFKFLKEKMLIVPPRAIVECFSRFAMPIFDAIQNHRFQSEKLAAARDLLLPRLISGQLLVSQAERELEAV